MGRYFDNVTMDKKISVIVRTYNSQAYIKDALQSLANQTLNPAFYEIIVVDDGSTDETRKLLKQRQGQIHLVLQEHKGFVRAANVGIEHAKGSYIILLDADDLFDPAILATMYDVIKKNPDVAYVYCDYFEHRLETGEIKTISVKDNIFHCLAEGILFKKTVLGELGLYNESLFFPEYDILINIYRKRRGVHIPRPLFTYNRHMGSLTSNKNRVEQGKEQLKKKHGDIPEIAKIRDY